MSFVDLKHIPCPKGEQCTAFMCLFQHKADRDKMAAPSAPALNASGTSAERSTDTTTDATRDGPRKRLKVAQDVRNPADSTRAPTPVKTTSKQDVTAPRPDDTLSPVARPISPPPLKRPSSSSSTADSPATTASSTTNPTSLQKDTPSTPSKTEPPKTIRKAEALNPRLLKSSPAKFEIRFKLVQLLHEQYVRLNNELEKTAKDAEEKQLVLKDQDLIWRVLDEEESTAIEKGAIYSNVIKNKIMQYKKMTLLQWKEERVVQRRQTTPKGPHNKAAVPPKKIVTGLNSAQEVQLVRQLITPIDGLAVHGYVSSVPAEADIQKAREGLDAAKGWEKCDRCDKRFQMFPGRREEDGALASGGSCNFHWGKTYFPERQMGDRSQQPKRYRCCGQAVGDSAGCHSNVHHVFKASDPKRLASVLNYAETPANPNAPTDRAVGFDCEMCYTVHGLELIRITATSWPDGEELLDVLVQPIGEILDLNSRYSGVWPEDMASAEPWTAKEEDPTPAQAKTMSSPKKTKKKMKVVSSPEIARDLLFALISPETPLIGHGLENDLNAVRIVHPTVIDTVLLFPHKHGLPYRLGLKMLMDNLLSRKIQVETAGKVQGHDSAEDARAAGDLVRLKLSEEWKSMKLKGWKLEGGEFVPPGGKVDDFNGHLTAEFLESAL
ncbi:exonuclease [Colletotrichum phormii]|uniref:Exonuclease n=1 Tax=Colletotrichum phormii TaxID=359342 RepID=A0AAI9ZKX6_9PEZI|nr:exonuclease [Colletotrichum phormii]KAK1633890.1 exonuclease [Colletotrichum phormii]